MKTIWTALAFGLALAVSAPGAWAQARTPSAAPGACDREGVDRASCLQDIRNARAEQRRNGLVTPQADVVARNLRARCEPLPADDRQACLRRMTGEGTISGSVQQGALLRELAVVEASASEPASAKTKLP